MKTFLTFLAIIVVAGLVGAVAHGTKNMNSSRLPTTSSSSGLQSCPDEKIDNKMPTIDGQVNASYYIVKGERREMSEYDTIWVATNCTVSVQAAY